MLLLFVPGKASTRASALPAEPPTKSGPGWALQPLAAPPIPSPGPEAIVRNPLDAFIAASLDAAGIAAAPEARPRDLLRRLYHDLTGLPPGPGELAAFRSDAAPDAYERVVDRLLASPRHGEHWARHWMDVASYADTHGNDHDFARPNAWRYRDYVIRAFNEDRPYARFVQEQVAGDVLFPDDPQATLALGFLAAGPWDHTLMVTVREDTVDHRMAQVLDRDNIVSSVIGTFQSLTVHCARCHDHKFDPISQREYYGLQAVFAGVDRADRPWDEDPATLARRHALLARKESLARPDAGLLATLDTPPVVREVAAFSESMERRERQWTPFEVMSVVSTGGATLERQPDGSWFATGVRSERETYVITARRPAGTLRALRVEALPDDRLPQRGPGRFDNGHFHLTGFRAFLTQAGAVQNARALEFSRAMADVNEGPTMSAAQAVDGRNDTHWGIHPHYGQRHEAVFELREPVETGDDTLFTLLLEHQGAAPGHALGRFRLSAAGASGTLEAWAPPPAEVTDLLRIPASERSESQRRSLALAVLRLDNARALEALPPPQFVYAVARDFPVDANFKPPAGPRPVHLLARGDIHRPGDLIQPASLGCIPGLSSDLGTFDGDESARRAALARWLTDPRNVLLWRSIVNRVWHWHFGRGLCDTPSDFGQMGGTPSHPELLDWLAVWFRDEARGSLKALHRLIVTSAAYRRSSAHTPHRSEDDPQNRRLARMNSPRLTAEEVRDTVLQLSGQLDLTMGGPAAVQFVSKGAATFLPADGSPPFLDYEHFDADAPANRRRAVYRFLFRTVSDPFMEALDCPDGGAPVPSRSVSTTALQ
ncbi:MAG: DUF1549 domain-containing protein, partial [Verrucomicrobia bacterium]|nr:DUF1549 domain-containing protein [Verrucomicrobiota bacterium]